MTTTPNENDSLKQIERDVQNLRGQLENPRASLHHAIESLQGLETEAAWLRCLLSKRLKSEACK